MDCVTISSHGKPIAILSPPDKAPRERPDPLANASWIRQPTRKRLPGERFGLPSEQRMKMTPGATLSAIVLQDRD